MSLIKYQQKRKFDDTPEPEGKSVKSGKTLKFVVQKHAATRLHYDFRLELDGVLKSWAVPKGPSMNTADKRLAMMVEDHPYSYKDFEGIIPKGNYGAGTVMVWDEGNYSALTTADAKESAKILRAGLQKGEIKFFLNGSKLKGGFVLVKIKNNYSKEDNAWLLIKEKDEFVSSKDITKQDKSAVTGLDLAGISSGKKSKPKVWHSNRNSYQETNAETQPELSDALKPGKDPMLHKIKPMLATLVDEPFAKQDWLFEIKWDGYRAIAEVDKGKVKLYSRNDQDFSKYYPKVYSALQNLDFKAVFDGEIVVIDKTGKSQFQLLQEYRDKQSGALVYYVFDLLYYNGRDLRNLPLIERKNILKQVLPQTNNIRYSDHVENKGVKFFTAAQKKGLEGIMAKNSQSEYRIGRRTEDWLKIKTHMRQEAVIGGFTEPKGGRKKFGALILGIYEKDKLRYIGHTGGGFNQKSLNEVYDKLEPLIQNQSPFTNKFKTNAPVTWVKPKLLAEISFSEWTGDKQMRQPIFLGLREDKSSKTVVPEFPEPLEQAFSKTHMTKSEDNSIKIGKVNLELTHLDKVFWPKEKYTKGDLIEYYKTMAPYILPYLQDRPESMNRHPGGINGPSFFQKDLGDKHPAWVKTQKIYSESNEADINYLICNDAATLLYMANLGCIEINPWSSRRKHLDKPDFAIIDLDPEKISFEKVIETAQVAHKLLDKIKVPNYCKTSGATGLHIYIPIGAKYTYDQTKSFVELLVNIIHNELPKTTSLERSPKKRQGKIYLDYLQNRKGQTLAAPYSVRPKSGATVSTPLEWREVKKGLSPSDFTIKNIGKRLKSKGDLWKPVLGPGIDLKKTLINLEKFDSPGGSAV